MASRGALWALAIVLGLGLCCGRASAAEGKLKGVSFFDYYYIASGADEKENGFRFRRIYLTYDITWDEAFSGRVRLEARDGGYGKGTRMEPFVKHAYLRYRKAGKSIDAGLAGTPTWNVSERVWGYRAIEATIMDVHKIGSSADMGVALHGNVDSGGRLNYQLMLGNGPGQSTEVDNGKKIYALLHAKPTGSVEATAYLDWEGRPAGQDRLTVAGFVGTSGKRFHGGVEAFQRTNRKEAGGQDVQVRGLSVFGAGKVGERAKAFGRFDFLDPSDQTGDDREYTIWGGIDLEPTDGVHIMPNVVATAFQDGNADTQVIPRMTVYLKF